MATPRRSGGRGRMRGQNRDRERGQDPAVVVGAGPEKPEWRDPDPGWQPEPGKADEWRGIAAEIGRERRPPREQVYPYLLIRAVVGDRGIRPTWPPASCWESPDILLIDASYPGEFDPSHLVISPVAGRSYRVFVRIWNLGLFPAYGVHVKAWAVNPGFFGAFNQNDPYYQQHLIGGRWAELSDRTRPDCTAVIELDRPWKPDLSEVGHHCLLAEVGCPLDQAGGPLLSNSDRHVGQRNLEILTGATSPMTLVGTLGGLVPDGFTLEVIHAGPVILKTMQALTGGRLEGRKEIAMASLEELRYGVLTKTGRHLLTAFASEGRSVLVSTERLMELGGTRVLDHAGGVRRFLGEIGPTGWARIGTTTDRPLDEALIEGLARLVDASLDVSARELAERLGGREDALHALRFVLTDPTGGLVGGYTVIVG
ncbi:hypothetical protein ACQP2U_42890 (plasmid) [Nocardia sp. CA-084685]|uniref:hypothetical protein n=1 Tax=Nocardia sp. CA-084685 TaxID=3239970 RepID=UPI003D95FA98